MYILYLSLIGCILVFFAQTIYTLIKEYSTKTLNDNTNVIGNIWFVCLLIINITILIFIYLYYNSKITILGKEGIEGPPGLPGEDGDLCLFKSKCNNYNDDDNDNDNT